VLALQCHVGRGDREQAVGRGTLDLVTAGEDVPQAHAGDLGDALELGLEALERRQSLLERGVVAKMFKSELLAFGGMMKKALSPSALRRSCRGSRSIVPEILISADARAGRPGQHR